MTGLIEALKSIPGAIKAATQLIGAGADVGTEVLKIASAKAQQARQAIEDQSAKNRAISQARTSSEVAIEHAATEADVAIMRAMTDAVLDEIRNHPGEIGKRALQQGVRRLIDRQANREAVTIQALKNLALSPPSEPPRDVPTDDWLNLFGRYAENASSEKLREHWSLILEGEIRKPGSFSFVTLQLASIVDKRLASIIESIRPWIFNGDSIPLLDEMTGGEPYKNLLTLAGIGFLVMAGQSMSFLPETPDGAVHIILDGGGIIIPAGPKHEVEISVAVLTTAATELMSALSPAKQSSKLPEVLLEYLKGNGFPNAHYRPRAQAGGTAPAEQS